ncbi:MAG TPA: LamG domain-containing protein [Chitinophagales bacterium]|nr:LamG domain-containing protein [Chitinophagales bacterium]
MSKLKNPFKLISTAVFCSLVFTIAFYSCKKDEVVNPADKTCLTANVAEAQALLDGTTEGTKPGQYVIGSKAPLQTALNASNTVLSNADATQSEVTNACAQLEAAMTTYQANLISEISPDNLIGFWKFNGNPTDSSGKGNNGTVTVGHAFYGAGTPTLTTDRFGRSNMCYHFDKGGNIEVPYNSALNPQQMTISLWCKKSVDGRTINPDTYTMVALNRWNGYKYQYQGANKFFFTVKATNGTDTSYYDRDDETFVADNDVWYHSVVTFTAGTMNFYVNGDLVKSWTDVPLPAITLGEPINFVIGQDLPTSKYLTVDGDFQVAWGGFFTGDLDDVMFYNVALDAVQVKSIYDNQKSL